MRTAVLWLTFLWGCSELVDDPVVVKQIVIRHELMDGGHDELW